MEPKFYNNDGSLTAYSLSCGKVQRNIFGVQLWKEYYCYHILRLAPKGQIVRSETYSLTEARKIYKAYTKAAKQN